MSHHWSDVIHHTEERWKVSRHQGSPNVFRLDNEMTTTEALKVAEGNFLIVANAKDNLDTIEAIRQKCAINDKEWEAWSHLQLKNLVREIGKMAADAVCKTKGITTSEQIYKMYQARPADRFSR